VLIHEYVLEFGILNQPIWSLARCDIIKQFEKITQFLIWCPCAVGGDFEILCIGKDFYPVAYFSIFVQRFKHSACFPNISISG